MFIAKQGLTYELSMHLGNCVPDQMAVMYFQTRKHEAFKSYSYKHDEYMLYFIISNINNMAETPHKSPIYITTMQFISAMVETVDDGQRSSGLNRLC